MSANLKCTALKNDIEERFGVKRAVKVYGKVISTISRVSAKIKVVPNNKAEHPCLSDPKRIFYSVVIK